MADKACEKPQQEVKEKLPTEKVAKEVDEEPKKEEKDKKINEENGDTEDASKKISNEEDSKDAADKDKELVSCPVKRKSAGGGGDAPENTPAEETTPEKKAKLDEQPASADIESNGEPEVTV